jgi:hypothetical protein
MLSLPNNRLKNLLEFAASATKTEKVLFILIALYAGFAVSGHQLFFIEYPVQQVFLKIVFLLLHATWISLAGLAFLYFTHISSRWIAARNKTQDDTPKSTLKLYTIFLSILIGWWLLWLVGFFPGTMSTDSFDHWKQAVGIKQLNDLHPILYTVLLKALINVWYSPAIMALLQIITLGAVMASFFVFLYKTGIPFKLLLILAIITAIIPVNGIMAITIWKDVLFCVCLVWLTLTVSEIVTNTYIFNQRTTLVCLGISLLGVALLRHNGAFVAYCVTLALIIWSIRSKRKGVILSLAMFLLVFFVYKKVIMPYVFLVPPVADGFQKVPLMHGMASVMYYNGDLANETRAEMEKLLPAEKWKSLYNPYSADGYIYETGTPFIEDLSKVPTSKVVGLYAKTFIDNPFLITKDRLSGCELLWNVNQGEGSSNYAWEPFIEENDLGFKQNENGLHKVLMGMLKFAGRALDPLSRRSGIYNIFFLLIFLYLLRQRKMYWLILLPLFASNISLLLSMTFQTFRYVYYIPLLFGVIWLLSVSGVITNKSK